MAQEHSEPKIGAGHAEAMFRQGLAELRGAFFNESNVAQPGQYGLYGTKTPGEVADGRRESELDREEEPIKRSTLDERLQQTQDRGDDSREARDIERD